MSIRWFAALLAALVCTAALADEASVKREVEARLGGITVNGVARTPYFGLYEVLLGDEIVYTDEKVTYIFSGSIIEAKSRRNLTEERQLKLSTIRFEDLPLELAIKQTRGNGKRVVAIFSDPNCPYCKRLDRDLMREANITIYTFLYPILRADSPDKSRAIWCSPDRAKAYYDLMLNGREPALGANCGAPVEKWLALGQKLGIKATPTSFTAGGQRVLGARTEDLVKLISENAK